MPLSPDRVQALLAARTRRREAEAAREQSAAAAELLRSIYYPKQQAFYRSSKRWRATRKTRRAGATAGGCRELIARALEQPGFRATYGTTTRGEAEQRAWRNDNQSGFVDLLEQLGEPQKHPTLTAYRLGGAIIEVRESDLILDFSNGSQIELFGADNVRRHRTKRGNAKHVFWLDEAQDFPHLERFFDAVVIGSITDYEGEAWFTGTPGLDCSGMFFDVTKEPEDGEEPLPGWDVHSLAVVDNPFFGRVENRGDAWVVIDNMGNVTGPHETAADAERAAVKIRWERTAGEAIRLKGWKGTEPDLRREWYAEWVREDARYVYPVRAVPKHEIVFAPQRLTANPFAGSHERFAKHPLWYDHHAAVRDLPLARRGQPQHQWLYALGVDFGYHPDPFALVLWAFCHTLPDVYEMFSWKCTRVHTDDQGAYMKHLFDMVDGIVSFVGDPAGKQDDFEVWQTRMNLPIEEANKRGKNTLEEFLADDIRRGRVHLREDSPLYLEMLHLVYLPTLPGKPRQVDKHRKVNGIAHGDHCADGGRYAYVDLTHYLSRAGIDRPKAGSREALMAEAEREERRIDDREAARARAMAEGDEYNMEYGWQ